MSAGGWDARIQRAEQLLAEEGCAAAELLRLYVHVARAQKDVYAAVGHTQEEPANILDRLRSPRIQRLLLEHLPGLVAVVAEHGPGPIARRAREVLGQDASLHARILSDFWQPEQPALDRFFARVLNQAAAERMSAGIAVSAGYERGVCPVCESEPVLAVLREENLGARRSLLCSLCSTEWPMPRVQCPSCGEARSERLGVYAQKGCEYMRADVCEVCKVYVRTVDLSKMGTAVPLVDEIAALPLWLWASDQGYTSLAKNIFDL